MPTKNTDGLSKALGIISTVLELAPGIPAAVGMGISLVKDVKDSIDNTGGYTAEQAAALEAQTADLMGVIQADVKGA